ncbi:hypothetical protein EDB89DRAFT_431087 [Lactarius sanguifluus]|nr:hypothetical protein EDB89DRAFT_431087 [Lactarius sanguifluus]
MFYSYDIVLLVFQGTLLVDGSFHCFHRLLFSRDSVHFSARLGTRDHEALTSVVSLGDVERQIFEAPLSVIYPKFRRAQPLISTMEVTSPCTRDSPLFASWLRSSPILQRHTTDSCLRVSIRSINGCISSTLLFSERLYRRTFVVAFFGSTGPLDCDNASRASPEGGAAKHGTSFTTAASSVGVKGGDGTRNSGGNHPPGSNGVAKAPEGTPRQDSETHRDWREQHQNVGASEVHKAPSLGS